MTGSTSLRIQGVNVPIHNDIDILTDKTGAYAIDKLLAEYRVKAPKHSATDQYQSYYGVYKINDIQIEIMGEFQYRLTDGGWSKPNHTSPIFWQEYDGMKLPMLSLQQELIEYENLGRTDKIVKIREALTK